MGALSFCVKLAKLLTHVVVHPLLFRSKDSIQIDLDVKSASLKLNDQLTLYFLNNYTRFHAAGQSN